MVITGLVGINTMQRVGQRPARRAREASGELQGRSSPLGQRGWRELWGPGHGRGDGVVGWAVQSRIRVCCRVMSRSLARGLSEACFVFFEILVGFKGEAY